MHAKENWSACESGVIPSEPDRSSSQLLGDWFYFSMSLLILVVVVYGFAQRAQMQLIHPLHPKPLVMWIHAVVFWRGCCFIFLNRSWCARGMFHYTVPWGGLGRGWEPRCQPWGRSLLIVMRRFDLQYSDLRMIAPDFTLG